MFAGSQPLPSRGFCAVGSIIFGESAVQILNTEAGILRVAVKLELLYSPALLLRGRTKVKALRYVLLKKGAAAFPVLFRSIRSDTEAELLSRKSCEDLKSSWSLQFGWMR